MKRTKVTLALLGGLAALASFAFAGVETGEQAPAFTLTDARGNEHSLSDLRGKYVVLEWFNHRCPFVRKHYDSGHMQSLQKKMTNDGVVWLQVVSSAKGKQGYLTPKEARKLKGEMNMHSTAFLRDPSGKVGQKYDARTTPHMFLINPEGKVVYQGAIDSVRSVDPDDIPEAENYVEMAYNAATNGKPVEPATTEAYGCSIKY